MTDILLVDDDQEFLENVSELLGLHGFKVTTANSVATGKELATNGNFDVFLLDLMLDDGSGLQVLEVCSAAKPMPRVAIITGHPVIKNMVSNLYGPSVQYLLKPIDVDQLLEFINGQPQTKQPLPDQLPEALNKHNFHYGALLGESTAMQKLYRAIDSVATTKANVLVQGDSGAGKELVARAIHQASSSKGPFVAANCGAFSRELIGSELFGHEKGAFTGAVVRKHGLFEQANGGTLFLDEITEMPLDLQPNLLRALETKKVIRVGGREEIPVDCQVISATNRKPEDFARGDILREDLYYRLAVFPLSLPSLKERKEDIPLLANAFLQELNREKNQTITITKQDLQRLCDYEWPGNVRELRHAIHRAFILTEPSSTTLSLPANIASPFAKNSQKEGAAPQLGTTIEEMEKDLILSTLASLNDNKPKAAEMLGISLKTLYNRLNTYELE